MLVLDNLDIALFHIHLICAGTSTSRKSWVRYRLKWRDRVAWFEESRSTTTEYNAFDALRTHFYSWVAYSRVAVPGWRAQCQSVSETDRQAGQVGRHADRQTDRQTDHRPC